MSYKDKYITRNKMYGNGIREIRVNNSKRVFYSVFKDSPSYYQVFMSTPMIPTEAAYEVDSQIVDNSEVRDEKKLTSYYETDISVGNLFKWQEKYWLMIHQDNLGEIYKRGIIRRCYTTIKWQDSDGAVKEAWFANKTDVSPNFGIDDRSKIIVMPDERRQILVQSNDDTRKFNKTQKFIFDGRAWKIITLDITGDGIVDMVLDETFIDPAKDNEELRIADYMPVNVSVEILNGDISIDLNQKYQLDIKVYKNNYAVDMHEITLSSTNESVGSIDRQGLFIPNGLGNTTIIAEYMGQKSCVNIQVRDILINNYSVEIIGSDTIDSGQTQRYRAIFKNNGVEIDEAATFTLMADNGVTSTKLATIKSQENNEVVLLADQKMLGYILLCVNSNNQLISGRKRIRIKTLF